MSLNATKGDENVLDSLWWAGKGITVGSASGDITQADCDGSIGFGERTKAIADPNCGARSIPDTNIAGVGAA
jgi:hypothetical protein